ncbi:MAG: hypothetical protein MJZ33_09825 [Paludibacteraceae bacterium]|nr:hypothetical protein [Paludibacteraceae bacterium]
MSRIVINTSKSYTNPGGLLDQLDKSNYFQLSKSSITRKDLFTFALGLGLKESYPKDIEKVNSIVRTETVGNTYYLYSSVYFHDVLSINTDNIDKITDDEAVYELTEKYANAGFEVIEQYMNEEFKNDDELMWKLIGDMDEIYEELLAEEK